MDGPFAWAVIGCLVVLLLGVAFSSAYLATTGTFVSTRSGATYSVGSDLVWLFLALAAIAVPAVGWIVRRSKGGSEALNLYLVYLAAVAIIHIPGLILLKFTFDWSWPHAFALGSTVFLPMDAVKAGAAVLISLPFLPTRNTPQTEPNDVQAV